MWMLSFLPDNLLLYIVNGVLIVGAIGSFLSFFVLHKVLNKFPALAPYHLVIQIVSAVLLIAGIYFKGGYGVEMEWRDRIAKVEAELAEAKLKSENVKIVIQEKVVTKTKIIKEKADVIVKYVDRPAIQDFDKKCPLPQEAIDVHNEAARMNKAIEEIRKGAAK